MLIMGIDVGTSGVKVILMDEEGNVVGSVTKTYPLLTPKPAWSEQLPEDWWMGTVEGIRELMEGIPNAEDVKAVGLSGQMHGLVPLDAERSVIRNAILWNDQRTADQCDEIIEMAGGLDALVEYTNNTMLPGFTGGKLLWVKENEPENFAKIQLFCMPKDYIRYRLTDVVMTDVSEASGTGFFDVKNRAWAKDLIEKCGFDISIFPDVVESDEISGRVTAEAAAQTGIPEGTPVYGGGGDAVIQNTGMGIVRAGTLGLVMGTSGVAATALDTFGKNEKGLLQFFCNNAAGRYMAFGCMLACAGSMEWYKNTFYKDDPEPFKTINEQAENSTIGAGGVVFLPYLSGERCPYSDPDARGVFYGMSLKTDMGDLARAVMEGVTFGLYQMFELIQKTDPEAKFNDVVLSGGAAKSDLWKHIVADVFGLPVKILTGAAEGGAYGASIVAAVGEGVFADLADAEKVHKVIEVIEPDMKAHDAYMEVKKIYDALYYDLKETYKVSARVEAAIR